MEANVNLTDGSRSGLANLWHAAFSAVPIYLYFFYPNSVSILRKICIYIHNWLRTDDIYELPLLPNNTAMKHFSQIASGAKCRLDSYHWGAGLVVTGPIRDIGQNILQYSFETGSSRRPCYLQIFTYRITRRGFY
jgi:hypothetical protein